MTLVRLCLCVATLFILGCASGSGVPGPETREALDVKRVAVLPFQKVTQGRERATSVRCPLCGAMSRGGPVEKGAEAYMTTALMAWITENTPYTLIPLGTAQGVRAEILSEEPGMPERRLLVETGKKLQAGGVMSGTIHRFQQRVGTSFSVETPASVAFGVHFVSVADGRLVWFRHFDETQESLSENILRLSAFVRRGGRWLTAEELASFGLHETMATLPLQ